MDTTASSSSRIRIGIGCWTFEPWRGNFYPAGLAHSKELHYASRQLSAIEVNGTYYSTFKPPTFAKWHSTDRKSNRISPSIPPKVSIGRPMHPQPPV